MKLKGQLQWTDYLNAQILHIQPAGRFGKVLLYGVLLMIGLCLLAGIFLSFTTDQFQIELMIPGFILAAFIPLYRYVFLPWRVKKIFLQQKDLSAPFEMEIADAGLIVSTELANVTRPWTHFTRWKENEDLFLLYLSDVMYIMIPKRLLSGPEQAETIRVFLEKNKVPAAKSRFAIGCVIFAVLYLFAVAFIIFGLRTVSP